MMERRDFLAGCFGLFAAPLAAGVEAHARQVCQVPSRCDLGGGGVMLADGSAWEREPWIAVQRAARENRRRREPEAA